MRHRANAFFKAGNAAAALDLKTFTCVGGTVASIREYFVRTYYLSTCNVCSPFDNIPTLKRTEIRNGTVSHTALAEGVIGMQFEYGFDTTAAPGDGVPDVYRSTVDADATKPEGRWSNVVSVRAHMLIRSVDPARTRCREHGLLSWVPINRPRPAQRATAAGSSPPLSA